MRIKLIDNFYIETDAYNFMLREKYMGKDENDNPKERIRTIGYYSNITHALQSLITHMSLTDDEIHTIEEYIQKCKKLTDEVTRALREVSR